MLIKNYTELAKQGKFRTIYISTDDKEGQLHLSTVEYGEVGYEGSIIYSSPTGMTENELEEMSELFRSIRL